MKKLSFDRNQLKYLVIAAMLIDHIAWAFVPMESALGQVMHFIGRLTGPTMAYFLTEGYIHTRNVKKYAVRLGIFALVSWAPFCLFEFQTLPVAIGDDGVRVIPQFGVIYTLFLSLLALWLWDKGKSPKWCKVLGIFGLCVLSVLGDWPVLDILYVLIFYSYREQPRKKWIWFCVVSILMHIPALIFSSSRIWILYELGILMVPLLVQFCYNGQGGSRRAVHKWFFYIFYPLHLLALGLLQIYLK